MRQLRFALAFVLLSGPAVLLLLTDHWILSALFALVLLLTMRYAYRRAERGHEVYRSPFPWSGSRPSPSPSSEPARAARVTPDPPIVVNRDKQPDGGKRQ